MTDKPEATLFRRVLPTLGLAAIGSAIAAVLIGVIAKGVGVQHASQLQSGPLASLSIIGVAIGTLGWVLISRRAAQPERLLQRLVPTVLIVSLVPDVIVGLGSDSWGDAASLATAHVAVFAVTISLLATRLAPSTLSGFTAFPKARILDAGD